MAANDGASGVAVMLEIARQLQADKKLNPNIGVDFVCFDTEDWGTPQWADVQDDGDTWALGAQYWSENKPEDIILVSESSSIWWADREPSSIVRVCLCSMPVAS